MAKKIKKHHWSDIIQFIKLQLAGNVLFWVTYLGSAFFDRVMHWPTWQGIAVASIVAHVIFFIIDKNWVFSDKTGKRKTSNEVTRFICFMGLNYFLNLGIITGIENYLHISPYIGQFIAAGFFTIWTWLGLKFWVFRHIRHVRHSAITIETRKTNAKRHVRYQRLQAKQKAKRAA